MKINLINTGKRFNREWIFRNITLEFSPNKTYAITGVNGSGKSTLLQIIAGASMQSEGSLSFNNHLSHEKISDTEAYKEISFVAPYLDLIEEMTAHEFLSFHSTFKPLINSIESVLNYVGLEKAHHKQIRYFSSGMKQRLKLAQAFFSDTSVLLLDEPTTNLDTAGIELYLQLIKNHSQNRLVIVCSNDKNEYNFCNEIISIDQYK